MIRFGIKKAIFELFFELLNAINNHNIFKNNWLILNLQLYVVKFYGMLLDMNKGLEPILVGPHICL